MMIHARAQTHNYTHTYTQTHTHTHTHAHTHTHRIAEAEEAMGPAYDTSEHKYTFRPGASAHFTSPLHFHFVLTMFFIFFALAEKHQKIKMTIRRLIA